MAQLSFAQVLSVPPSPSRGLGTVSGVVLSTTTDTGIFEFAGVRHGRYTFVVQRALQSR